MVMKIMHYYSAKKVGWNLSIDTLNRMEWLGRVARKVFCMSYKKN